MAKPKRRELCVLGLRNTDLHNQIALMLSKYMGDFLFEPVTV